MNFAAFHFRYELEKLSHSCGIVPYPSSMSANVATAPSMHCAHVAGSAGFGRLMIAMIPPTAIKKISVAQISRPAGCAHENVNGPTYFGGSVLMSMATTGRDMGAGVAPRAKFSCD